MSPMASTREDGKLGKQRKVILLVVAMVVGMTSLSTITLSGSSGEVEDALAQRSLQTAQGALQEKPVSAAGAKAWAPVVNPADSPASQVADETSPANAGRPLEAGWTDSTAEFRPFSKAEMIELKRRELLETGQYEQLDRFEAKLSYEGKRKKLNKRKREQLRELDRERRELSWQVVETDDREFKEELRALLRELRRQRDEAQYAFVLEARQAREELRNINEY